MNTRLGVIMDPISDANYAKDSTLAMLWEASARGWQLFYMEQQDLHLVDGVPLAAMRPLEVFRDVDKWFSLGPRSSAPLDSLDVILMRKDPPFDNEYLYSTYILEAAQRRGCLIVNDPRSVRDCNEKLYATHFPQCCPPLLVSRDVEQLRQFHMEHGDVVFKPLDGMGGTLVFRVREDDPNLNVILETVTQLGQATIMAQRFVPQISAGDKRILMIEGKPVDYVLARIPAAGESRGNLAAGGKGVAQPLSERDRWICAEVADDLRSRDLIFVGLDVIGDYLTEINVTSPTCIREIDSAKGTQIAADLLDAVNRRLGSVS